MIRHIQSTGIVRTVYLSIFKDTKGYSEILMHIYSQSKTCKKETAPILEKMALVVSIFGLNFLFKM